MFECRAGTSAFPSPLPFARLPIFARLWYTPARFAGQAAGQAWPAGCLHSSFLIKSEIRIGSARGRKISTPDAMGLHGTFEVGTNSQTVSEVFLRRTAIENQAASEVVRAAFEEFLTQISSS